MKIFWAGFLIACMTIRPLFACDLCNFYTGIGPNYNQNMVGIRYRFHDETGMHAHIHCVQGVVHSHSAWTDSRFRSLEITGRLNVTPRLRVVAQMPVQFNTIQEGDGDPVLTVAQGDLSVLAQYQLLQTRTSDTNRIRQRMLAGGGLKLPTGKFSSTGYAHEMAGTGSWDFFVWISHILRWRNWGWGTELTTRFNTRNPSGYKFGHRINLAGSLYHTIRILPSLMLLPHAGVVGEAGLKDDASGFAEPNSGGLFLAVSPGLDLYAGKFSLTNEIQVPFVQQYGGLQPRNGCRWVSGINYSF